MTFTDLLQELGIRFLTEGHHHCRPGWLQLDCPFCGPNSEKYHLGYNVEHNFCHCWKCGHQRVVDVLVEYSGASYAKIQRLIGGIENDRTLPRQAERKGTLVLPLGIGPLQPAHKAYLRHRGFEVAPLVRHWRLQGIGIAAALQWRIFIPIYHHGKLVSWTTRSISDKGRRYISAAHDCEAIPHRSILYGADYARQSIIIVEGPTDVWRIGPGAVATCGIGFTAPQLLAMSKFAERYVCYDSEDAAQLRASQLCDQLEGFPGTTTNIVLDADDPGSAQPKEIRQLRKLVGAI